MKRLAPVDQRGLEGIKRAGKLGHQDEDAPDDPEPGREGDAALTLGVLCSGCGRLRRFGKEIFHVERHCQEMTRSAIRAF